MITTKATRLDINHPELQAACEKITSARRIRIQMQDIEKEAKETVRMILEEFPDTEKFTLPTHTITLEDHHYQKPEEFKKYLMDNDVEGKLIQAATAYARTKGRPKLKIDRRKDQD